MKVQAIKVGSGDAFYAHINPDTGRLDEWGILIGEHPNFEEGGVE